MQHCFVDVIIIVDYIDNAGDILQHKKVAFLFLCITYILH